MPKAARARARYMDYRACGFDGRRFMTADATDFFGRLIRTSKFCGDPNAIAYIVAIAVSADAMELVRTEIAQPGDTIEDLGRVSDALLRSLNLCSGEFVRANKSRRAQ